MMEVLPTAVLELELELEGGVEFKGDESTEYEDVASTELDPRVVGGRVLIIEVLSVVVLELEGSIEDMVEEEDVARTELVVGGGGGTMITIFDFEVEEVEPEVGGVLRGIGDVGV